MRALILVAVVACDHTSPVDPLVAGGDLISIAEGETRTLELSDSATLGPADAFGSLPCLTQGTSPTSAVALDVTAWQEHSPHRVP